MVSLLLSRAIAKLFPDAKDIIRITLCVNQRKALHVPLAHQSLVGGVIRKRCVTGLWISRQLLTEEWFFPRLGMWMC